MAKNTIGYIICEGAGEPTNIELVNNMKCKNRVFAKGTLQDVDILNRNRRIYARDDLFPTLKSPRILELLSGGNLKGEAGHPMEKDLARQQTIEPKFTQVLYTKLWTEGDQIKAIFRGTNNAYGQEFNDDLLAGELPSFSLRALGTIESVNGKSYVRNIKPITWDRVYYPSHKCAYTDGIISESASINVSERERINEHGIVIPITNDQVVSFVKEESANLNIALNTFDVFYESMSVVDHGRNLRMVDRAGNTLIINLEGYVQNEIMDYCMHL